MQRFKKYPLSMSDQMSRWNSTRNQYKPTTHPQVNIHPGESNLDWASRFMKENPGWQAYPDPEPIGMTKKHFQGLDTDVQGNNTGLNNFLTAAPMPPRVCTAKDKLSPELFEKFSDTIVYSDADSIYFTIPDSTGKNQEFVGGVLCLTCDEFMETYGSSK